MTDNERKKYEQSIETSLLGRGDLEYVGWEPLTEEEKRLVEALKKADAGKR